MSASGTGRSHGRSSAVKRSAGSWGYQSSGSTRTTGAVEPAYSRRAASLSSRWRSASGSSADVGPGPPSAAPDDVTTTLCPSSRTIDWGASGGTAKDVSPSRTVLSGVAACRASGLMRPSGGASTGVWAMPRAPMTSAPRATASE